MSGLKDTFKKRVDDAVNYAKSEEAREDARSLARTTTDKVKKAAKSEPVQRATEKGREVVDEVLDHLVDGDTPTQAAARVAKKRLSRNKNATPPADTFD